jgi:tRNA(His) 5'-end guanylyltransferase
MCSIAASMATMAFNKFFYENAYQVRPDDVRLPDPEEAEYKSVLYKAIEKGAMFDARCFNIPKEEVTNLIYWRQLDATRNSIQMVGQANFSHKELQNKSCNMIQDMLHEERGINWNDFPTHQKRGTCVVRKPNDNGYSEWVIDKEIPIFKGEGRKYIEDLIQPEEE